MQCVYCWTQLTMREKPPRFLFPLSFTRFFHSQSCGYSWTCMGIYLISNLNNSTIDKWLDFYRTLLPLLMTQFARCLTRLEWTQKAANTENWHANSTSLITHAIQSKVTIHNQSCQKSKRVGLTYLSIRNLNMHPSCESVRVHASWWQWAILEVFLVTPEVSRVFESPSQPSLNKCGCANYDVGVSCN